MTTSDKYGLRSAANQLQKLADELDRGDFTDRRYVPAMVLRVLQSVVHPYGVERLLFRLLHVYLKDRTR
ncbi:hypothetical protein [Uliginosibacterium sp. TH139]|uniref:hypothetical protein n=1 Tax=Uliginosibacterium sp. TH139 TaxID=2067453 RepID=UPI0013043C7D|nr:hypothetical protein [Uliginosibacterium sp. TH139]